MKQLPSCVRVVRILTYAALVALSIWLTYPLLASSHMKATAMSRPHCRTCTAGGAIPTPGAAGQPCSYQAAMDAYWCDCQPCKKCDSTDLYHITVTITEFAGVCSGINCSQAQRTGEFVAAVMNVKRTSTIPNCDPVSN